jgi:hypothetical protein
MEDAAAELLACQREVSEQPSVDRGLRASTYRLFEPTGAHQSPTGHHCECPSVATD